MQIDVLWSKQPDILDIQMAPITAQSRKLRAKWSAEIVETKFYGNMSPGELESLHDDPMVKDVIFEHGIDGNTKVTVKRINPEPNPDEMFEHGPYGLDGQIAKFKR